MDDELTGLVNRIEGLDNAVVAVERKQTSKRGRVPRSGSSFHDAQSSISASRLSRAPMTLP